jgi:hypothetical protein
MLHSTVSDTEVVVVRAPAAEVDLNCCGVAMGAGSRDTSSAPESARSAEASYSEGLTDDATRTELLCTKAGSGPLSDDGRSLEIRAPKPSHHPTDDDQRNRHPSSRP